MTADGLTVIQCLFTSIWSFFTSWYIPGTNTTPGGFLLFLVSASICIKAIIHLLSHSYGGVD